MQEAEILISDSHHQGIDLVKGETVATAAIGCYGARTQSNRAYVQRMGPGCRLESKADTGAAAVISGGLIAKMCIQELQAMRDGSIHQASIRNDPRSSALLCMDLLITDAQDAIEIPDHGAGIHRLAPRVEDEAADNHRRESEGARPRQTPARFMKGAFRVATKDEKHQERAEPEDDRQLIKARKDVW